MIIFAIDKDNEIINTLKIKGYDKRILYHLC